MYGNSIEFIMKYYYIILQGFKLLQIILWLMFVIAKSVAPMEKIVREKSHHHDLYWIVKSMVCHVIGRHCN